MATDDLDRFCETFLSGIGQDVEHDVTGLDEEQRAALLQAITPGSATNQFEERHQYRNFALILTLYDLGARNGEIQGIKGRDIHAHGPAPALDIHRRHNDPDDVRCRPPVAKTRARRLPISAPLAHVLSTWTTAYRNKPELYPGAKRTPHVFVSELGRPIAANTVEGIFIALRRVERIPPLADRAQAAPHLQRPVFRDDRRLARGPAPPGGRGADAELPRRLEPDLRTGQALQEALRRDQGARVPA